MPVVVVKVVADVEVEDVEVVKVVKCETLTWGKGGEWVVGRRRSWSRAEVIRRRWR